ARALRRKFPQIAIWWGTTVEAHSALNRLALAGKLNQKSHAAALNIWQGLEAGARIVNPVDRVCEIAKGLPSAYGLRAMDSFQLAAALVWCREKPQHRPFITADVDLSNAAAQAGFSVTFVS
ncbi:MAG: type II toxin-antitoxin system VapC family toxin, partial [Acidobacteriota bacterium]|nr:type II toxin-antitoxin system VapC family toxin [Acidobacteriota bacterium]